MKQSDLPAVERMMYELWPDFDGDMADEHVLVSEDQGRLNGFISFSVRPWVEGTHTAPCPHIEGWFVDQESRRKNIGTALMKAAEAWCKERGYRELTSDVEVQNSISLKAHRALGFQPTVQIQFFKKEI